MQNFRLAANDLPGLAGYLYRDGYISLVDAQSVLTTTQASAPLHLLNTNLISHETLLAYCKQYFPLPFYDLTILESKQIQTSPLKPELIYRYRVVSLGIHDQLLHLGITDPTDQTAISAISFDTGLRVKPFLVDALLLETLIDTHYRKNILYHQLERSLSKITMIEEPSVIANDDEEPIIDLVNRLIEDAIKKNSSDIHLEPFEHFCRIRFRCDGLLQEITTIPSIFADRLITRLKVMAELNIAERRLPQDGRLSFGPIDLRISTCPTLFGEKIALRILYNQPINLAIEHLGLNATQQSIFVSKLQEPQGLILVTGPTGSGKTATLYAALNMLNTPERNISSVEDPVEIKLHGINQVQVNHKIGLDFLTVLKTFLRQDPDILMIGELRDKETADIAMQASQTGHLVLATLHANSAIETINRLKTLGVNMQEWIHSISLIIAQRLVRKSSSQQTYAGRTGIFELLTVNKENATRLLSNQYHDNYSLWDAGLEKVNAGMTTLEELTRVLGPTS